MRFTYISLDGGTHEQSECVRPWQHPILFPPTLHNQADVESEHERKWHRFPLLAKVGSDSFEHPVAAIKKKVFEEFEQQQKNACKSIILPFTILAETVTICEIKCVID